MPAMTVPADSPVFPFATFSYGVVVPARCNVHGVDSQVVCASLDFTAAQREAAVHVLRCGSHAAESPLACHDLYYDLYHGHEPRHPLYPHLE